VMRNEPCQSHVRLLAFATLLLILPGCYAPLASRGIPACTLSDEYRVPWRTAGPPLNLSTLTIQPPEDYRLGAEDILEVTIPGLYERAEVLPIRVQVMGNGDVQLPLVGTVSVQGMNLLQAQRAITAAYAAGFIVTPRISLALAEKSTTTVLVLGQVTESGAYELPKYENDIGHAIGAAGGLTEDAADYIEIHRQFAHEEINPPSVSYQNSGQHSRFQPPTSIAAPIYNRLPPTEKMLQARTSYASMNSMPSANFGPHEATASGPQLLRIPLRGANAKKLEESDIILGPGDVVVVPDRRHEVFYVVGALSTTNTARFTIGDRERELGVGFILPRDREIDVVTAVAMAGYIDPIYSPTTVTVHRVEQDGTPTLILVDLIKARYDRLETILVQPGDIIYLNPDHHWWWRRFIDRTLVQAFTSPYNYLFR
jgi:polysaccharide biosynthesis/export protein